MDEALLTRCRHEAQMCYCGEWNCVGTIGGKTQTDIGGMDDLFLDGELSSPGV
jgi:histone-lysine N-methyltransferase SETD2